MAFGLGVIGIFVPLLPTTPFFLLSAALFLRSSKRLYNWLINHRYFGKYIKNYLFYKTISLKSKIISISLLWVFILFSIFFIVNHLLIKIVLLCIAIGVTWHILSFKTASAK
ncbi:MAG: YbaN family protein [Bacteroidales bacterium]|nr:YbaN family protein [Bacteroidales bacterium]